MIWVALAGPWLVVIALHVRARHLQSEVRHLRGRLELAEEARPASWSDLPRQLRLVMKQDR